MKKQQKWQSKWEYDHTKTPKSDNKGEKTLTIPDASYTIRELLDRHSRGMATEIGNAPQYPFDKDMDHDDVDLEELARMDMAERQKIVEETKERIRNLKGNLEEDRQNRITAYKEKFFEKTGKTMVNPEIQKKENEYQEEINRLKQLLPSSETTGKNQKKTTENE